MKYGGEFRFFPKGTYEEQMSTPFGRQTLLILEQLRRVADACMRESENWKGNYGRFRQDDLELFKELGLEN